MASSSSIYFDKSDEVILHLVNRIIDSRSISSEPVLEPHLHPHGIKELVDTPVARMAYAVANLLRNLESGGVQARDRLLGLQVLYDEVLSSAHTTLRRNTARVLMQIMKSIVRAHGKEQRQLKLAHDFRAAAQGTPRIVRRLLKRYHLPEMDESWNQIAFDDHVYDMNTKGRKSPTHLIMDAWIKGIKTLTVIYDNCVSIEAAREILSAAAIVGISVRIGLEFRVPFRGRFIDVLWAPRGFSSNEDFLEFLASDKMRAFSDKGRDVVNWEREMVLQILAVWNDVLRPRYASKYAIEIPPLGADDFLNFLGRGHASVPRLAECLFKLVRSSIDARAQALAKLPASAQTEEVLKQKASLEGISSDTIQDEWLNPDLHPELPQLSIPEDLDRLPELRRLSPYELMKELAKVNAGYRMVLCTTGLSVQDVMELLWDCKGMITHLEIFSMRGWMDGLMPDIHEIGELQVALNSGQGPRLKQMVRQMIRDMQESGDEERRAKFEQILHAIPTLWEHYRHSPLKSRIGTGSSSRARSFGMGLVVTDTLPARGVKMLEKRNPSPVIPVWAPVEEHVISREPEGSDSKGSDSKGSWLKSLSWLPGLSRFGRERRKEWVSPRDSMSVSQHGNIANLGGLASNSGAPIEDMEEGGRSPGIHYLNSGVSNFLKLVIGFVPAFLSFIYTQDWWVLQWLGAVIWFGITGVRNVVQMVLAAKGVSRNTLLHWRDQVSVSRLCDSLMYTGISVFLLEVIVRVWVLDDFFGMNVVTNPVLVFTVYNCVNGLYIFWHNIYRGFPRSAAYGNIFRAVPAIPIAAVYHAGLTQLLFACGVPDPSVYLIPSTAVVSKVASDTVAAVIEGFADSHMNMHMRAIDYRKKLQSIFDCYTRLELLFPQEDALIKLARPGGLEGRGGAEAKRLERALIVNALDLMYFWYCQPRAQDAFKRMVAGLTNADRTVFALSQLVLMREREVSQLMVDGLVGRSFARPLAFFLNRRKAYVKDVVHLCQPGRSRAMSTHKAVFGSG
jgi:hypothetical protein